MTKARTTLYIDKELMTKARGYGLNISFLCCKILREEILRKEGIDPRAIEIQELRQKLSALEQAAPNIESSAAPREQAAPREIDPVLKRRLLIAKELKNWGSYIRRGFLSTSTKREAFYKQRSRELGLSLEDYLSEIVDKANIRLLGRNNDQD